MLRQHVVEIVRFDLATAIRREPVLRLLRPHLVETGIGGVEALQYAFY